MPARTRQSTVGTAPTRREAADLLADAGVDGRLAERMLRRTAPQRHAGRVGQARAALLAAGVSVDRASLVGALVAHLDAIGVGVTGRATTRHPALVNLGKGRKQASDGAAWSAAIDAAAESLPRIAVAPIRPDPQAWARLGDERPYSIADRGYPPGLLVAETDRRDSGRPGRQVGLYLDHDALPAAWLERLAEEAVAHLCGAPAYVSGPLPVIRGTAVEWAALWTTAHQWSVADRWTGHVLDGVPVEDPVTYLLARHAEWPFIAYRGGGDVVDIDGVRFRLTRVGGGIRADVDERPVVWPAPTLDVEPGDSGVAEDDQADWEREVCAAAAYQAAEMSNL